MNLTLSSLRNAFLYILVFVCSANLTSCGFCTSIPVIPYLLAERPLKELASSEQDIVFEAPGQLIVYEGHGCAQATKDQEVLKVEQSLMLPAYATQATVYLNGWHLGYMDDDHHIAGLGTLIANIRMERNLLTWQAAGALSDKNFDDDYDWCYYYTIIAWNPNTLNIAVDHTDNTDGSIIQEEEKYFTGDNRASTTALSFFPTFLHNPDFVTNDAVAVLPRGMGFTQLCEEDHHLLQIGYNMDHTERFIENEKKYLKTYGTVSPASGGASRVDSAYVSWETAALLKDNSTRRVFFFGEIVSGLGGDDLGVIQPPFSILPQEDELFSGSLSSAGVRTQEFVVENIPYNYAVPMLTGWDLGYLTADQHVREIGVWIDKIRYEKAPAALTGTLRYRMSSVLRDNDSNPDFFSRHKVTILGLQAAPVRESIK